MLSVTKQLWSLPGRRSALLAVLACAAAAPAGSQAPTPQPAGPEAVPAWLIAPATIGSEVEDRARLDQLLGRDSASGFVVRSLSSRLALRPARGAFAWAVLAPELNFVSNSDAPFSQNDGALWAGRGSNYTVRFGAAVAKGPWRLVIAPEIVSADNALVPDVDVSRFYEPPIDTTRYSTYSSPYTQYPFPMDQPFRPGYEDLSRRTLGQSAIWYEGRHVAAGLSTENNWWGPGVREALILTNNAEGFPHAFVRTPRPLRTGIGEVEARWIVGALRESGYFDKDPANDDRSLAALAVTYRPNWEPNLTLGVSRAVYAGASSGAKAFGRWLDVLQPTTRPNSRPWSDSTFTGGRDQLTAVSARWLFPRAGTEVYGELGRAEWPASVRDFLVDPTHTMGYLIGGQVARPWETVGAVWRVQAEFVSLERSTSYRYRPTQSWYTSRAAPQGYTHRGQVLGASIGPGSSQQWIAFDVIAPAWRAGAFAGRWRINADAHNIFPYPPQGAGWCEYDTAVYPGLRGGYRGPGFGLVNAELLLGNRLNYLYQSTPYCPGGPLRTDLRNTTLRFSITPGRFR